MNAAFSGLSTQPPPEAADAVFRAWPVAPRPGWQELLDDAARETLARARCATLASAQKEAEEAQAAGRPAPPALNLALDLSVKEKFGFLAASTRWLARAGGPALLPAGVGFALSDAERAEAARVAGGEAAMLELSAPFWKAQFFSAAVCADCAAPGRPERLGPQGRFQLTACEPCAIRLNAASLAERVEGPDAPAATRLSPFAKALMSIDHVASGLMAAAQKDFWPDSPEGSPPASPASLFAQIQRLSALRVGRDAMHSDSPLTAGLASLDAHPAIAQAQERALEAALEGGPDADLGLGARALSYCSSRYSLEACLRANADFSALDAQGRGAGDILIWRCRGGELASLAEAAMLRAGFAPKAQSGFPEAADSQRTAGEKRAAARL